MRDSCDGCGRDQRAGGAPCESMPTPAAAARRRPCRRTRSQMIGDRPPRGKLLGKRPRVGRTRRRQRDRRVAGVAPRRFRARGRLAVEAHERNARAPPRARRDASARVAARIAVSRLPARSHATIVSQTPIRCARSRARRSAYGSATSGSPTIVREQRPEVVARVRVVLARRERGFAGKAAEDQHARVGRQHRRQSPAPARSDAGLLDYLRAAHSGIRPWGGPAGLLDDLRAAHSGIRPWDGPAGSCANRGHRACNARSGRTLTLVNRRAVPPRYAEAW